MVRHSAKPRRRGSFATTLLGCLIASITGVFCVVLWLFATTQHGDQRTVACDPQQLTAAATRTHHDDTCEIAYEQAAQTFTNGLTVEDLERSRAYVGNRYRLSLLGDKLSSGQPTTTVVCGGSITLGHGVTPETARYSNQLEQWLNLQFPVTPTATTNTKRNNHMVLNKGSHGADMCAMAKRMNLLDLQQTTPDLFILEFAVNDYQGQDHKMHIDHKTDVFFDGFRTLALCAETVVHKILSDYPNAAVVFLEFQTAILNRKTAQLLHMGVAQHYQVPVISYADALFPGFHRLAHQLSRSGYSIPNNDFDSDPLPAYPHGCSECHAEHIIPQFRDKGCKSLCVFMKRSGYYDEGSCDTDARPCYISFLAHDAVHPSAAGHGMAKDFIAETILQTIRLKCQGRVFSEDFAVPFHSGWMVAGPQYHDELRARSDFVLVHDTMEVFAKQDPLRASHHSDGFVLRGDQLADRKGWIAEQEGETITFDIDLPRSECYVIYLSVLKSYETVGSITVFVKDKVKGTQTDAKTYDLLWKPRISIPADLQLTSDDDPGCTGSCQVLVTTNAEIPGRGGNKVKIMSLSVRHCLAGKVPSKK